MIQIFKMSQFDPTPTYLPLEHGQIICSKVASFSRSLWTYAKDYIDVPQDANLYVDYKLKMVVLLPCTFSLKLIILHNDYYMESVWLRF